MNHSNCQSFGPTCLVVPLAQLPIIFYHTYVIFSGIKSIGYCHVYSMGMAFSSSHICRMKARTDGCLNKPQYLTWLFCGQIFQLQKYLMRCKSKNPPHPNASPCLELSLCCTGMASCYIIPVAVSQGRRWATRSFVDLPLLLTVSSTSCEIKARLHPVKDPHDIPYLFTIGSLKALGLCAGAYIGLLVYTSLEIRQVTHQYGFVDAVECNPASIDTSTNVVSSNVGKARAKCAMCDVTIDGSVTS